MPGFIDNFRKAFHNFQNRRGTVSWAVSYPPEVGPPSTRRRPRADGVFSVRGLFAPRYARRVLREPSLGSAQPSEANRKSKGSFRVEIVFLGFSQHEILYTGFVLCFDIFVMPEHAVGCIVETA